LAATTALSSGTYYATIISNGCESAPRKASTVNVNATPNPAAPSPQNLPLGSKVSSLRATGNSVKWYSDANTGNTLAATAALASGNYYASQTINGVESCRTPVVVKVPTHKVGTDGNVISQNSGSFIIYPNPNNGTFEMSMTTTGAAQTATVQVLNILGQVIYTGTVSNDNGAVINTINLNNKAPGLYIVRVICGQDVQEAKVQITK
jgi:hypothetical protein